MSKIELLLLAVASIGGCIGGVAYQAAKPVPPPEVMKVYETPLVPPEDEPITRQNVQGDESSAEELNNRYGW